MSLLLRSAGTLVAATLLVFSILLMLPTDPARLTLGQRADQLSIEQKRRQLGLDRSRWQRMADYLNDVSPVSVYASPVAAELPYWLALPLGERRVLVLKPPYLRQSFQSGRRVNDLLAQAIPPTLVLAVAALLLAVLLGLPLGLAAGWYAHSPLDRLLTTASTLGVALPSFVTALLVSAVLGVWLGPVLGLDYKGGLVELSDDGVEYWAWHHLWLPALSLGVRPLAVMVQLTRAAVLDTLPQPFIRTAYAKGLPVGRIVWRHLLPNALNPVVTAASGWLASLLTGAFFVETVFEYDGLGILAVEALREYDLPVVLGVTLFSALVFVLIGVFTDTAYRLLDPRMRQR